MLMTSYPNSAVATDQFHIQSFFLDHQGLRDAMVFERRGWGVVRVLVQTCFVRDMDDARCLGVGGFKTI